MAGQRISPAMRRVLEKLSRGLPATSGFRTQSEYGGLVATMAALRRKGLIDQNGIITDAGRQAIGREGSE